MPTILSDSMMRDGLMTISKLLNEQEPRNDIVENLFAEDEMSLLIGRGGTGKSTLTRNILLRVAKREPFLGRQTRQGNVIGLFLQESKRQLRDKFKAMGATPDLKESLIIKAGSMSGNFEQRLEWLDRLLKDTKAILCAIDTLTNFMSLSEGQLNDHSVMEYRIDKMVGIARNRKCHIMALHHPPWNNPRRPAGSISIEAGVDMTLIMEKKGNGTSMPRILSTEKFRTEPLKITKLCFTPATENYTLWKLEDRDNSNAPINGQALDSIQKKTLGKIKASDNLYVTEIANKIPVQGKNKHKLAHEWIRTGLFIPVSGNGSDIRGRRVKYKVSPQYIQFCK